MTIPQMLIPSTRRRAFARRALRASSLLCALGLLGAAACSDNTGDDVITDSPNSGNAVPRPDVSRAPAATPGTANDPATSASGTQVDNDESGLDDSSDIAARSGTRSTAGGGGSRRRSRDDEEITTDAGVEVEVDAGEADAGDVEVVEDAGVIVVDAGDAG